MTAEIIILPVITRLDLPPERVLDEAKEADLKSVVIIGYDQDGDVYFSSSIASGPDVNWLLDQIKSSLLSMGDERE